MGKLNEWIEYRKNKKVTKREMAKIMATTLPTVNCVVGNTNDIVKTIVAITDACQNTPKDELIATAIDALAKVVEQDTPRVVEIIKYITTLSPEQMRKIVVDGMVETTDKDNE